MTSKESMEFYALVGPDVARHIAEGGRIMGPVRWCKAGGEASSSTVRPWWWWRMETRDPRKFYVYR